jgi:hypothetical protein
MRRLRLLENLLAKWRMRVPGRELLNLDPTNDVRDPDRLRLRF